MVSCETSNPYADQIKSFFSQQFPSATALSSRDRLEMLTEVILSSKPNRFGPRPSPEGIVSILEVIRNSIHFGRPIPFMVPWRSEKPDGSGPDVAELMALKQMERLHLEIKRVYLPGAEFAIRIEDASAPYLLIENQAAASAAARHYTGQLCKMINIANAASKFRFIRSRPESVFVSEDVFSMEAEKFRPDIEEALNLYRTRNDGRQEAERLLEGIGWTGGIREETRHWYESQYQKLYPGMQQSMQTHILARYFASAVARRTLGIRGDYPEWGGSFIDLTFAAPIPGTQEHFGRRVHYRTLPLSVSSAHMPPWRAKGYLQVETGDEDCRVRVRLASFNSIPEGLVSSTVQVTYPGEESLELPADYLV